MIKVTFIGTSHGIPERDRTTSATMLECGEDVYFIDGGTNIVDAMIRREISPKRIKAVFTTHSHGDHTGGLVSAVDLYNWCYRSVELDIFLTREELATALYDFCVATGTEVNFDRERIRLRVAKAGEVYEDENLKVTYYPNAHMKYVGLPSYSILVTDKKDGSRLVFSGDMSGKLAEGDFPVEALSDETDLFVCEMAHFKVEHILPYLENAKIKKIYINHYRGLDRYPELPDDVKMINEKYGIKTELATDGLVAEV